MNAPPEGAFIPCGHRHACVECGERVMRSAAAAGKTPLCPSCIMPAAHFLRIFT